MGNIKVKDTDTEEQTNYLFLLDSFEIEYAITNPQVEGLGETQTESDES